MFTIDGVEWDIPCKIERTAEIKESELSGLMLDKSYFSDPVGTYMKYSIGIAVPFGMDQEYEAIYELLTDPVDGHSCVVPYNRGTITITGRIVTVSDVYVKMPNDKNYWRNTKFDIIANAPTKTLSLDEVITRGRAPMPDLDDGEIGDTWTYTSSGWIRWSSS